MRVFAAVALLAMSIVHAEEPQTPSTKGELLTKIKNPFSGVVTVPFENTLSFGPGSGDAVNNTLDIQPIFPIIVSARWLLITQVVAPIVYQEATSPGGDAAFGFGDAQITTYGSRRKFGSDFAWGFGGLLVVPTSTDGLLGAGKWCAGPAFAGLWQVPEWTATVQATQTWSFAGGGPADVSSTLVDPAITRTWKSGFGLGVETETTYDWNAGQWTVPLELEASGATRIGGRGASFAGSVLYYAERGPSDPRWGLRFTFTLVFKE